MALMAAVGAVPTLIQAAQGLGNPKDAERFAANADALARAQGGDPNALAFLKQRTGQYGIAFVPGYGEVGGWATDSAKGDAKAKYTVALARASVMTTGAQVGQAANEALGTVGYQVVPKLETWQIVALVGVVGFVAFSLLKK